jgi:hypothetical protein
VGGIIFGGIFMAFYIAKTHFIWDFSTLRTIHGLPLAADFANYWSASKLVLSGHPVMAYNINELHEVQQQAFGTHHYYGCGWYYPPHFFLMIFTLGLMPYLLSFCIWIGLILDSDLFY